MKLEVFRLKSNGKTFKSTYQKFLKVGEWVYFYSKYLFWKLNIYNPKYLQKVVLKRWKILLSNGIII